MPAADRRQLMLRRISRIRRTVAGVAVALFLAAFLVVYVQLATGHDPALAGSEKRGAATKQSTVSSAGASEQSAGASEPSASSSSKEPTQTTESNSAEAVTTRQS
jgi:hypothetical protein